MPARVIVSIPRRRLRFVCRPFGCARRIVVELVLHNLLENAVKYGGDPPHVEVDLAPLGTSCARLSITNNGQGVPVADRNKIFRIFYRGGNELQRRNTGTGLGLYIVQTLVKRMHGKISVHEREDRQSGATFVLELPGRIEREAAGTPNLSTTAEPQSVDPEKVASH